MQLAGFYEGRIYPLDANIWGLFQVTFPNVTIHT